MFVSTLGIKGDPDVFSHEILKCDGWWKALSCRVSDSTKYQLIWSSRHWRGNRVWNVLYCEVPRDTSFCRTAREQWHLNSCFVFLGWGQKFSNTEHINHWKSPPCWWQKERSYLILDAGDNSATWVWLLDFSCLTKKSHVRIWGCWGCWLYSYWFKMIKRCHVFPKLLYNCVNSCNK